MKTHARWGSHCALREKRTLIYGLWPMMSKQRWMYVCPLQPLSERPHAPHLLNECLTSGWGPEKWRENPKIKTEWRNSLNHQGLAWASGLAFIDISRHVVSVNNSWLGISVEICRHIEGTLLPVFPDWIFDLWQCGNGPLFSGQQQSNLVA